VFVLVVACIIQTIAGDVVNQSPSIAMFCGKNSMHRDLTTGEWQPDPEGNANCTQDKAELFLYCKKMYPTLNISNIVSENSKVTIGPWCSLNHNEKCKGHNHQVTPVKCLVGTYESPALKVAASCKFNHKHDSSICKSHDYWADQALTACKKQNMRLEDNYSMLQACDDPDQWHGVEYVCCPTTPVAAEKVVIKYAQDPLRNIMPILQGAGPVIIDQQQHPQASPVCSLPMLVGRCKAAFPRWYYNPQSGGCTQFVYGGCGGNGNNFETREECEQQCQVRTHSVKRDTIPVVEIKRDDVTTDDVCSLPKLTGPCRALFHKFYFNKVTKSCELFVYGGCGGNGNNFESEEECSDQCQGQAPSTTTLPPTTTTTEELIVEEEVDVITDDVTTDDVITDPDVENQQYLRARMEEDTWYSNQVSQVIADWGVENAAILKKWQLELEQKVQKDKLQKEFNRKIQELKETHDSNLERITTQHQTKMDAFIEEDRSKSYETFKQQIDVETPDSDMVLQSLELYLTSEKRGQDHIVTNFQVLFDDGEISDEDAEGMRGELQQKLNMIQSRAMETIALLNQHPQMKEEIQETIDQMFTSILPSQQLQLPTDDSDSDDTIDQGGLPPQKMEDPIIEQQPMHMAASAAAWDGTSGNFDRSEEGIIRWISICCGCVALVVILAALARYYQANKLHHSQFTKIQVDDHLTVEEKQLLQMQQNGYENPTYKFFEKQQQHPQA